MGLFLLLKNLQKFCSTKDSIFIEGGRGCYLRSASPTPFTTTPSTLWGTRVKYLYE
jgi:hypothetical protein